MQNLDLDPHSVLRESIFVTKSPFETLTPRYGTIVIHFIESFFCAEFPLKKYSLCVLVLPVKKFRVKSLFVQSHIERQ